MKEKNRAAPARHAATRARLASSRRTVLSDSPADGGPARSGGQRAAHDQRRRQRERRHRGQGDAPRRRGGEQRHADAPDQAAEHERGDVQAHGPRADALGVGLGHVRHADGEQPGHAEPLRRAHREQDAEARRQRDAQRRHDQRPAGQHERTAAADAVRQRSPEPRPDGEGADDHRHRQAGLRRLHRELAAELGQDRLRRVHRGEHRGCGEQERPHPAQPSARPRAGVGCQRHPPQASYFPRK